MIWFTLTLRLIGDLAYIATLTRAYPDVPFVTRHDDGQNGGVVVLRLVSGRILHGDDEASRAAARDAWNQWSTAVARLHQVTPVLTTRDHGRCNADLSLNTGRTDSQSNFFYRVPEDVISAAGAAGLALGIAYYVTGPDVDVDQYD